MTDVERLYDATNGGLQIICDYNSDAREACAKFAQNPARYMFSYQSADHTPSAHLYKAQNNWVIKDFSSSADKSAYDPIDVFCMAEGMNRQQDFHKVITFLMQKYGLESSFDKISTLNKPLWDEESVVAPEGSEEGDWIRETRDFTEKERKIMGKFVTDEHLKRLKWHAIERMGKVKNGRVKYCHSTENFPIFCRECVVLGKGSFWKIYQPLAQEKKDRFWYQNAAGLKDTDYVCNLNEFVGEWTSKRNDKDSDDDPDLRPYTQGVVLCCGERDSLACLAMGWWPIWMNSETAELTEHHIRKIKTCSSKIPIYYIPDLDDTGRQERDKIANKFPEIWVVELPEALKEKKDNRGKPMKDLRDWMESEKDMSPWKFQKLMETATRVQFWNITYTKNGDRRVTLDTDCLHFLLRTNGYQPVHDEDVEGAVEFGHRINEFIIEACDNKKIIDFVLKWCADNYIARDVKNALLDGVKLDESKLMRMISATYNFVQHDENMQKVHFNNVVATVSKGEIKLSPIAHRNDTGSMIWKKTVIDRDFSFVTHDEEYTLKDKFGRPRLDDQKEPIKGIAKVRTKLFSYKREVSEDGIISLSIDINEEAYRSKAFATICATSHIYWQNEQMQLEREGKTAEQIAEYWQKNFCRLDSPYLTAEQIDEQKASLISKLFIIGYYGWDFNSQATPWSAFFMDDFDGEGSNGGSGKSLTFDYIGQYKEVVLLDGRRKDKDKDKHIFAGVTPRTRVVLFDDFIGDFAAWYKHISSGLTVEKKGVDPYTIPPDKSPKLAFTSNYVNDRQGSSRRRQILTTCSSFFHAEGGAFRTQSTPSDYVGTLWGVKYSDDDWKYDDNIFLTCIEEAMPYIQLGIKIEPPMERAELRKLHNIIGRQTIDFLDEYFALGELTHANQNVPRPQFLADFKAGISEDKRRGLSDGDILEKVAMWCHYRSWVLGYCPKGLSGWKERSDQSGNKYNQARIIIPNPDPSKYGAAATIEAIYVANLDNMDGRLQYLKEKNERYQQERKEIDAAVSALSKPELKELPL